MIYRIEVSPLAVVDVEEAYLWLRERSPEAGAEWYNGFLNAVDSLSELPFRCPLAPESEDLGFELRQFLYGKRGQRYRILYTVVVDSMSGEEVVRVLRVRHGARDALGEQDFEL